MKIIKKCPECGSKEIKIIIGKWKCPKCGWIGLNIEEEEVNDEEFIKFANENLK